MNACSETGRTLLAAPFTCQTQCKGFLQHFVTQSLLFCRSIAYGTTFQLRSRSFTYLRPLFSYLSLHLKSWQGFGLFVWSNINQADLNTIAIVCCANQEALWAVFATTCSSLLSSPSS